MIWWVVLVRRSRSQLQTTWQSWREVVKMPNTLVSLFVSCQTLATDFPSRSLCSERRYSLSRRATSPSFPVWSWNFHGWERRPHLLWSSKSSTPSLRFHGPSITCYDWYSNRRWWTIWRWILAESCLKTFVLTCCPRFLLNSSPWSDINLVATPSLPFFWGLLWHNLDSFLAGFGNLSGQPFFHQVFDRFRICMGWVCNQYFERFGDFLRLFAVRYSAYSEEDLAWNFWNNLASFSRVVGGYIVTQMK